MSDQKPTETKETAAVAPVSLLGRVDRFIVSANCLVLVALLATMAVIIFVNVVMRYVTRDSIIWAEELGRYMMIWLTFLGTGITLRFGGHLAVDTLQAALPAALARTMRAIVVILIVIFCGVVVWAGVQYAEGTWLQETAAMEIPFGAVTACIPIGLLLVLYHLFAIARGYITAGRYEANPDFEPEMSAGL